MNGDYLSEQGAQLITIRLLIEGAAILFEDDAQPLAKLAMNSKELKAAAAFDSIGTALADLREAIRAMQETHMQAVMEHINA